MRRLPGLIGSALLLVVGVAEAQINPIWLRADTAAKSVDFKLVAGLRDLNGGMNFNGFTRGGLLLTVPQGWTVVLQFKNQDQNLPHSVEVIADTSRLPVGPVPPAFDRATTGKLEQGFSAGQGTDVRFLAGKVGSFLIFCAVPGHGGAGMWIRLSISATAAKPTLTTMPER
ncbi:MAG TPA: sulfocyanin-like copper-binding protein [Gemmatimonadales bacterium]|nr:sulfocyanin-like copper-binding protein [Gemmatimonadales bacterium]